MICNINSGSIDTAKGIQVCICITASVLRLPIADDNVWMPYLLRLAVWHAE